MRCFLLVRWNKGRRVRETKRIINKSLQILVCYILLEYFFKRVTTAAYVCVLLSNSFFYANSNPYPLLAKSCVNSLSAHCGTSSSIEETKFTRGSWT